MSTPFLLTHQSLELHTLGNILDQPTQLKLAEPALARVQASFSYLQNRLAETDRPLYGVNTGFGSLCNTVIAPDRLADLQRNLIRSHACGTGDLVPQQVVRAMLLLKITSLTYGYSGVAPETLQRLIDFFNAGIYPVIFTRGSLGASGDLAPLAHLALPLIGEGEVWLEHTRYSAELLPKRMGWQSLELRPKEGLALLNGTQFMGAYGVRLLLDAKHLLRWANAIAAMSLDAFACRSEPFHPKLQEIRPHPGQIDTAEVIRAWLAGSALDAEPKSQVQDPYSFRCIPQVHGAIRDAILQVQQTVLTEVNGVSDNPNIFPEEDLILAGGNFHGQAIALALDYLTIALVQLGSISERRVYQLQSGQRGLPAFLAQDPGLNSGFMILQYTAAGLVNACKQRATPNSHDSIPSCNGQEDFVSMGGNAAVKAYEVLNDLRTILAIELMHASQALHFRPHRTSPILEDILQDFRAQVPIALEDRIFSPDIEIARQFLTAYELPEPDA